MWSTTYRTSEREFFQNKMLPNVGQLLEKMFKVYHRDKKIYPLDEKCGGYYVPSSDISNGFADTDLVIYVKGRYTSDTYGALSVSCKREVEFYSRYNLFFFYIEIVV